MVMERAQRLDDITRTLGIIINAKLNVTHHSIEHCGQMLNSLGYKNVLKRGYAIARSADNKIISSATCADKITTIEFVDGIKTIKAINHLKKDNCHGVNKCIKSAFECYIKITLN